MINKTVHYLILCRQSTLGSTYKGVNIIAVDAQPAENDTALTYISYISILTVEVCFYKLILNIINESVNC